MEEHMMKKCTIYLAIALLGAGLATQAEQINNGDFSAGDTGWTTVSTNGSSVTITNGVASLVDTGDATTNSHKQAIYQNFSDVAGDQISFSFDLRFDEVPENTWRISLYETNNDYDGADVFRSFVNYHGGSSQWRYTVVNTGANDIFNLTPVVSTGDWIRVSVSIDLYAGTSSGSLSNLTTAADIGNWSDSSLLDNSASKIKGFAVYDANGNTVSSSISVDNVSVDFVPTGVHVADGTIGNWNDASVWSNGVPGVSGSAERVQVQINNGAQITLQSGTDVLIGEPTQIIALSIGQEDQGGHNILTINGGTLSAGKSIVVGNNNASTGTLNMVSGSLETAEDLSLGNAGNDGICTFNMTGGSVLINHLEYRSAYGVFNYGGGSMVIGGDLISNTKSDPAFVGELNYTALSPSMNPLVVSNDVILTDLNLGLALDSGYTPAIGDSIVLVEYAGTLSDTFVGLEEGSMVDVDGASFQLSYAADLGDGRLAVTLVSSVYDYAAYSNDYGLVTGPYEDQDDDGMNNLYEFGLNGDPTNQAVTGTAPEFQVLETGEGTVVEYVHLKRLNSGLDYYLEITPSLNPASWDNSGYTAVESSDRGDGFSVVTNTVSTEILDAQFIRLIIEEM